MRGRMSQDQFLLKWNNHQNNFVEVFNFLRTQDAFVDVTLACDGKSFSAHKVVLSACSPYFQALFQANPCKHPIVFLKDVKGQDMEALIEFIYKGEVSVSQTELGSLISTAENLKIKGLAEPERPIEKAVKRLASPPRGQATISTQSISAGSLQHGPIALFQQSSPSAKRKRCDQYTTSHSNYTNSREKDDKISINTSVLSDSHRDNPSTTAQVVLVPTQDSEESATDLSSQQSYVTHHPPLSNSDGVLYSVAGAAIYVGSSQGGGSSRSDVVREVYPSVDQYNSNSTESNIAGTSGVQGPPQQINETPLNIKMEPTVPVNPEGWDGSNQSYEDASGNVSDGGGTGGGGSVGTPTGSGLSSNDPLSLALPLHSELTESSPIHESSRGSCVNSGVRCHDLSTYGGGGNSGGNGSGLTSGDSGTTNGTSGILIKSEGLSITGSRRLLECEHCHKQFTSRFNLQRHQLIHTGAKPYECPLCHQRFNQSGHVKTHLRTRHPNHELQITSESNSI